MFTKNEHNFSTNLGFTHKYSTTKQVVRLGNIIVSALSLSLRDKDIKRERESLTTKKY